MAFLGIAGKNSRFCQNSLTYRDSVRVIFKFLGQNGLKLELRTFAVHKIHMEHGDFQVLGSKWPQIRTTYLCHTQITYGTLKGRYQVNLQEKITIIKILASFPRQKL